MQRVTHWAAAAAIVCGLAACATGPKTAEQRADDRSLIEQVQAEFASDPSLYSRHITVRADNGVVTLTGYTWTAEELTAAADDAQRASGVTRVVNNIEVDRGAIQDSGVSR
jgi:osmotically-inducible protein OsmY